MRNLIVAAFAAITLFTTSNAEAITGGQPTGSDFGNVGAFIVERLFDGGLLAICTGTLVSPNVFLTAAHCATDTQALIDSPNFNVYVSFDSVLTLSSTLHLVSLALVHPDFTFTGRGGGLTGAVNNDTAVLILNDPIYDIPPAQLPPEQLLRDLRSNGALSRDKVTFTAVGYGTQLNFPPPLTTRDLQRWVSEPEYRGLLRGYLLLHQNLASGNGGTCAGDSGGPVFHDNESGAYLVATTSWGDPLCVATGFYQRIDLPAIRDWVISVIETFAPVP